jgi:FMN-dependent oxidoreductase (nitrilotriacetate monooxygenase family)
MMVLGFTGGALGGHLAGWRHPDSFPTTSMQLQCMVEMAQIAERGGLDMMFLADGNGVRQMDKPALFAANSPSDRPAVFEPVTLFAALSQHTKRIGFVATATTTYEEPFTIARKFASLDHLSGGRAGWNLVTTQYVEDAKNFGRDEHMGRIDRYERARESLDVVRALWDSWATDAFPQDKSTGQYLDPARVRLINHRGTHFVVKGPLNAAHAAGPAGDSWPASRRRARSWRPMAARRCRHRERQGEAQKRHADIKGRMAKYGRPPDALRIMPAPACSSPHRGGGGRCSSCSP